MTAEDNPVPRRVIPPARTAVLLGLLVLVGFVIRIDALRNTAPDVPALGDARAYHLLAENLAEGRGYIRPYEFAADGTQIKTAEYPPGLPVILAVATKAGATSETSQRVLMCAIGAISVGMIGLIARRLGGDGVGYLAAFIAAVHPGLWNVDVSLMAEPTAAHMGAALILAALFTIDKPDRVRWIILGVVAGLGCFARSEFFLMGPAVMAMVAWHQGVDLRARLRPLAMGLVAMVAILLPWMVRNYVAFDSLVPLSNNFGSVARGANCDAAYQGQFKGLWVTNVSLEGNDTDSSRAGCFAGFAIDDDTNEAEAAAQLRADGLAYMKDHAGQLPSVMVARVGRTIGLYQFEQQRNFAGAEGRDPLWDGRGTRSFQVLALLAVAGLVISSVRKTRNWERWLLVIPPITALIVVALTYGNPRFRAAAEPSVVILGALGIFDIAAAIQSRFGSAPALTTAPAA